MPEPLRITTWGALSWRCSAWDEDKARPQVAGTELILSIGGDGTILHSARIAASLSVPILGINLGRLGFITEIDADEVLSLFPPDQHSEIRHLLSRAVFESGADLYQIRAESMSLEEVFVKLTTDEEEATA